MSTPEIDEGSVEEIGTLVLLGRALRFLAPFKRRVLVKLAFLFASFIPWLILPWPIKIVLDHVVMGTPVGEETTPYPFFISPFTDLLKGAEPLQVLLAVVGVQLLMIVTVGAFGTDKGERSEANGQLAGGQDVATQTENASNAGFSLAGGLLGLLDFRWTMRLTHLMNHHYRSMLFDRIQSLPMSSFDDESIGDAVYRVMYDTPSITTSTYQIVLAPIGNAAYILISVGLLAITFGDHPRIYWSALAFAPLAMLVTFPFARFLRRRSGHARRAGATTTARIEESMANVLAVQSLGGNERERSRFDSDSWESFRRYRSVVLAGMFALAAVLIPGFILGGNTLLYIADLSIDGTISIGDFTLLLTYFIQILVASVDLGSFWIELQYSAAGLGRVFFLVDQPGEADESDTRDLDGACKTLSFEDVWFAHPTGDEVLRGVRFEALRGQVTAIVGPTGAGKTTLAYLVPRFQDPSKGHVKLDQVDLREISKRSLRDRIGFVFQETVLFDGSVEDNLRMAMPEASDEQIQRACVVAGADEFIRALPEGYATRLGRAGSKLSVGQRQRLSIARALVRDPEILILDEPTSALDPETENRFVEALRDASEQCIVIVIAHRLSTIRHADQICFLDRGKIEERGSHDELMARPNGAYRRYVELQSHGAMGT